LEELRADLGANSADWENSTLEDFLEALSAWTKDLDGYFENRGEQVPADPDWALIAKMLSAARVYE
jgi:hypothetical protein